MPVTQARVFDQQQFRYVPHTETSGEVWDLTRFGRTSGAGAANGTTLVDSSVGGSDNLYNGQYWILMLEGSAKGQMKRVVDYTSSTGTFTLEDAGFAAQIASGVQYALLKSPEPVLVVTTATSTTQNTATGRIGEVDSFWVGYYLIPLHGANRGQAPVAITAYTSSTGVFTHGALASTPAVGDVFLIGRFLEIETPNLGLSEEFLPRPGNRRGFSIGDGVIGPKGGSFGFKTLIYPDGAQSSGSAKASPYAALLNACGLETVQDSVVTAQAGSTTTVINIATGTQENITVGNLVMWQGNVRRVTAKSDGGGSADSITVSPALPVAPAASDVVRPFAMFRQSTSGDLRAVTCEWESDGLRYTMTGCKGNVTLEDGVAPMFAFDLQVDQWIDEVAAAPYDAASAYPSGSPALSQDREFYINGTEVNCGGFTATPGTKATPRTVQGATGRNGRNSFQIVGYEAGATWQELADTTEEQPTQVDRWRARTSLAVCMVYNGGAMAAFGVSLPAARIVQMPFPSNADGLTNLPQVVRAHDAGSGIVTGTSTVYKIPDFAFHIA